jgi:hypothetical protein
MSGYKLKISTSTSEIIIHLINWETYNTVLQKNVQVYLQQFYCFHNSENSDCGTSIFWVRLYKDGDTVGSNSAPHAEYQRTLVKKTRHKEVIKMEARDCSILVRQAWTMMPL